MKTLIEAVQVERREDGSYFHPALANSPDDDSAVAFSAWLAECGVEVTRVWMEIDAAPLCGRYMDDDTDALKEWQPTTPVGADWFLLAIFDTEDDGPVAYFVRPAPAAT